MTVRLPSETVVAAEARFARSSQAIADHAAQRCMVFASVGSMLPFDRLVEAVDAWAAANRETHVLVQIGGGRYVPRYAEWVRILPHDQYIRHLAECSLFVAHVGIGSMLQALSIGKQTLMMPRLAHLGEHTSEHQLHTVARFRDTPGLAIADDASMLQRRMTTLLEHPLTEIAGIAACPKGFTDRINQFLAG